MRFGIAAVLLAALLAQMLRGPAASQVVEVYEGVVAFFIALVAVGLVRSRRVGITLTDVGVVTRTTYATKRFDWTRLRHARTIDRPTRTSTSPFVPVPIKEPHVKVIPVLEFTNGRDLRLYGLQTVSEFVYDNWVYEAVLAINEHLEQRGAPATRG